MRILVTDSDSRSALAAVRALGRRGHEVICAGVRHPSIASASRFCISFESYPDPSQDASGFVDALAQIARRCRIDVVLPMTEITTLLATQHQDRLPAECRLPFPGTDVVANASNKAHVLDLARQIGVPIPRTVVVHSAAEGMRRVSDLPFPVVVKPARSRLRLGSGWVSTGVSYATDAADLARTLGALAPEVYPVLLQERINGPGAGVFACFSADHAVALFAHRRLREKPPSGGVSVLCESAPLDPVAVDHATRLLQHLGWRGVAMVEFKQDQRDGSLRLMEINGRFWGSLQLAIDAGVDFPSLAVAVATGEPLRTAAPYRVGVRSRWLAGDMDALLMTLFRSRARLNLPPSHPGKLGTLWRFLNPLGKPTKYEMEQPDDLGPARLEWRRRILRC